MSILFGIGRCTWLEAPQTWDDDGVNVSCGGKAHASSSEQAAFWEHQLRALARNDEDAVKVEWPGSPDLSGWYRVRDISVPRKRGVSAPAEKSLEWTGRLERCRSFRAPLHEVTIHGAKLDNDHSYTKALTFPGVGLPTDAWEVRGADATAAAESVARTSDTGGVTYRYSDPGTDSPYYDGIIGYGLNTSDGYDGASLIEFDVTGSGDWEPVVGREYPGVAASDTDDRWRIGNGLVRFSSTPTVTVLCEVYDSGAWVEFARLVPASAVMAVTILHNAPNMATVRLSTSDGRCLDLTVRRGELGARCVQRAAATYPWYVSIAASGAGTTGTGFVRASSNDANGNRWVLISPAAFTASTAVLANDTITVDVDALTMRFGIYANLGGSGAAAGNTVDDLVKQYMAGVTDRVTVEGR